MPTTSTSTDTPVTWGPRKASQPPTKTATHPLGCARVHPCNRLGGWRTTSGESTMTFAVSRILKQHNEKYLGGREDRSAQRETRPLGRCWLGGPRTAADLFSSMDPDSIRHKRPSRPMAWWVGVQGRVKRSQADRHRGWGGESWTWGEWTVGGGGGGAPWASRRPMSPIRGAFKIERTSGPDEEGQYYIPGVPDPAT